MRTTMGRAARFSLLLGLPFLAACPKKTAVWVQEGSTASNLVLLLGKEAGKPDTVAIGVLNVQPCAAKDDDRSAAAWIIEGEGGTRPVMRIHYGDAPAAFSTTLGPKPLVAGCYRVLISGNGETTFNVDASGRVSAAAGA